MACEPKVLMFLDDDNVDEEDAQAAFILGFRNDPLVCKSLPALLVVLVLVVLEIRVLLVGISSSNG